MKFNIEGKITANPEATTIQGKDGKNYIKKLLIIEVEEQNNNKTYTNNIAFEVTGDKAIEFSKSLNIGDVVDVSFSISSREWNDKYYSSIRAFNILLVSTAEPITDSMDMPTGTDGDMPF